MATGGHLLQTLLSLAGTLALHIGLQRRSRACHIKRRWLCKRIRPGCYRRIRSASFSDGPRINKPQSVTPEHVKRSCAGPKSSGPCIKRRMLWYLVLVSHLVQSATAVAAGAGARVAVSTGITAGAVHDERKQCHRGGENIGKAIERKHGGGISWTAKRALRRACARAVEHGGTHYRGRWYSSEHLGCATRGLNTLPTKTKEYDGRKQKAEPRKGDKRIKALTWNMSGASSAAWQELMAWLEQHQQSIDVALIQETHWRNEGSRDFETGPWNVLTTGCSAKDSKAGLAVLVHKRMGRAEMLSARTLIQGRIQHVRIHQGVNSTDIINVYQHVWRSQEDRESNLKCRASVWTQLRQVTAHILQRNTLLIGGDFNCTVRRLHRHVGSALSPVREAANDQEDFLSYLQDYGLSILNTWNARPAHTCHTGDARTQIDFLITRVQHADAVAKQSAPWQAAPVGRWKANHHVPVWGSVRQVHPCKLRRKQEGQPARAPIQDSIAAEDVQSQLLKQLVEDTLRQETWDGSMEQTAERLDAVLNQCVRTVYPPETRPDDRLFTQPAYQLKLKDMWGVYANYKRARVATMGNILHKWRLLTTFHKASKQFREHAKLAKRDKITRVAGELAEASARGDQRGLWQGAKKLAPWKPRTKMSIRGPEGTILSPEQQLQALLDHSTRKFCHGDPYISEHRMNVDFTVTEQEVERLVSKTPLRKAVPESVAPSALWKLCAASVSHVIVHALRSSWGAEKPALIPQHWKDSQLVWIAKPNKDSSKPQGYRPIGLSHPLANKLVRERLKPYLKSKLKHLPQFAYTNGRGVLDALLRVHSHLRNARQLSLQGRASIYELRQGRRANPCVGGLSFSLDLEGAFDPVPRPKLAESLRRLDAPEDLIHLAMEFYSDARYRTHIGEHKGHVTTTCGIKQGCTLAPYLFVAHTLAILEDIHVRVGGDWVQTCVTFFADDALGCWNIHSLPELRKAFADIQAIIDVFNEQGMTLSNDKSVVLYDLKGRDAGKFLARRKVRKHRHQRFLFHQRGQDLWVPIKKSHDYLGTVIAYRDAQSKTVTHHSKKPEVNTAN